MAAKSESTIHDDIRQLTEAFPDQQTRVVAGVLTLITNMSPSEKRQVLTPDIVERIETMRSREEA